jgi:hypothetical protein
MGERRTLIADAIYHAPRGDFEAQADAVLAVLVMSDEREDAASAARRFAFRCEAVRELHAARVRDVDGYMLRWCRECGQNWPCPTLDALTLDPPADTGEAAP